MCFWDETTSGLGAKLMSTIIMVLTCFLPGVDINKNGKGDVSECSHFVVFSIVQPKLFAELKSTYQKWMGWSWRARSKRAWRLMRAKIGLSRSTSVAWAGTYHDLKCAPPFTFVSGAVEERDAQWCTTEPSLRASWAKGGGSCKGTCTEARDLCWVCLQAMPVQSLFPGTSGFFLK